MAITKWFVRWKLKQTAPRVEVPRAMPPKEARPQSKYTGNERVFEGILGSYLHFF